MQWWLILLLGTTLPKPEVVKGKTFPAYWVTNSSICMGKTFFAYQGEMTCQTSPARDILHKLPGGEEGQDLFDLSRRTGLFLFIHDMEESLLNIFSHPSWARHLFCQGGQDLLHNFINMLCDPSVKDSFQLVTFQMLNIQIIDIVDWPSPKNPALLIRKILLAMTPLHIVKIHSIQPYRKGAIKAVIL